MDYDDTDFQSRNFQLASEDNSKSPSGLRPFALPKLDTDDQLHGHLRFGNLTDSEGFFSVGGHDNSWIEVLSTGSSVVDFSSSAAESCSISRSNYVWSEATSTECVEMLLKSVGENEMTGNMDGNAHQQLSGMDSQIGPSNMQPKSSDSPSDSIVVPTENDQSQGTRSRMPEDPLTSQPHFEDIAPFQWLRKLNMPRLQLYQAGSRTICWILFLRSALRVRSCLPLPKTHQKAVQLLATILRWFMMVIL